MLFHSTFSLWLLVSAFVALLAWAAASDFFRLIIPNRICLAIAALFPALPLVSVTPVGIGGGLLVGLSVFVAGAVLFRFGLLGGGDVKLLAAVSLWAGPALILPFVMVTAICGGILSLIWMSPVRQAIPYVLTKAGVGDMNSGSTPLPYGVAIAVGGLFVAIRLVGL